MGRRDTDLDRFPISEVSPTAFGAVIGRRRSGKSVFMRHLIRSLKGKIPKIVIFSGSEGSNSAWNGVAPKLAIRKEVDLGYLESLVGIQKKAVRKGDPPEHNGILIVFDDTAFDKALFDSTVFREIAMNGRHYNISAWMTMQWMMDLPTYMRNQLDYVVAFHDPIIENRKRLWRYFFGLVTYQEFERVVRAHTQDFKCLVLDNISCKMYWFRANKRIPPFKFGSPEYRTEMRELYQKLTRKKEKRNGRRV